MRGRERVCVAVHLSAVWLRSTCSSDVSFSRGFYQFFLWTCPSPRRVSLLRSSSKTQFAVNVDRQIRSLAPVSSGDQ